MRLISVAKMKSLEDAANGSGYTYADMMQKAGIGIAKKIHDRFYSDGFKTIIGLVGGGNNGGDALVALTELRRMGWLSYALLLKERKDDDSLVKAFLARGGSLLNARDVDFSTYGKLNKGILLDGVYGTGFHLPMAPRDEEILKNAKEQLPSYTVVAVDCPSGVDCKSGETAEGTLHASMTICLEAVKAGLLTSSAFPYCGEIDVVDLGLMKYSSENELEKESVVGTRDVRKLIPVRDDFSHKGTYGKVMVVGGSVNYPGAPILAGKGAYAAGCGLVQAAVPEPVYKAAAASHLELTWLILDDIDGVISENAADVLSEHIASSKCMVLGPGINREETTRRFLSKILFTSDEGTKPAAAGFAGVGNSRKKVSFPEIPLVIDADALVLLAKEKQWIEKIPSNCVFTPHPGEMAVLTGLSIDEIQANRIDVVGQYAKKWKQIVVLKGALTVVADADGRIAVIPVATSALAKAGTGDVLAGVIGGLIAQGLNTGDAAKAGAWIHGQAGILASRRLGCSESVRASDLLESIPEVFRKIHSQK